MLHTAFVYKIGPTCVGKGFIEKLEKRSLIGLASAGLRIGHVSFGQMIRDRLKTDPSFASDHGETVRRGGLLEDEVAIALFSQELDRILGSTEPDVVFVDGFCRSTVQIDFSIQNGFLRKRDLFCVIEAPINVCLQRFSKRSGDARADQETETFYHRYHLHRDTVGDLRNMLEESSEPPQIADIDASSDIAEFAFPQYLSRVLPIAFSQMAARKAVAA
jgi:adenylate kinase family enzyme